MSQEPTYGRREIRVFISSTFRDMHAEREELVKRVFPQLRKLCEQRGVVWGEVDLRWGVTDEQKAEGKVLPICLAEIQRCRPYFIGLLGERYGWVPEEIDPDLEEREKWLKEHHERSVTELEILHGVLRDPKMADHAFFYFRDSDYLNHLPDGAKSADFISESPESADKLKQLKDSIRAAYAARKVHNPPRENYLTPEALGELVLQDLTNVIDRLYPIGETPDPIDQEAMRHEAYAQSRRLAFIGREDLLSRVDEQISSGQQYLALTGESGCGKSALLAEWVARWREDHADDLIIQHYIGSTPESADWQGLVRRILGELKRAFDIPDDIPLQPDALRGALYDWTAKAAGSRQVVLVLDALNQLTDDNVARQLGWLPVVFSANFRVLVSALPGDSLEALRLRGWPELPVPLFDEADIAPATLAYFKIYSKTPSDELLAKLVDTPAARNPLYLRAVADELRQFGSHEGLLVMADAYLAAPDLPSLYNRILARWHDDFGRDPEHPDVVRRSLCFIACSRFGLTEAELLDLLGKQNERGEYASLPRHFWTPFYLAAESALAHRAGLLTFGHDFLRAAVQSRWLTDAEAVRSFRRQLADYFGETADPTDRKLDELPTLLRDLKLSEALKNLLADIPTFRRLRSTERWKWELHGFWIPLRQRYDPGEVYEAALAVLQATEDETSVTRNCSEVAVFHQDAGDYDAAEPLFRRTLDARERALGPEHPDTLTSVNNLALLLYSKGDYDAAEPLFHRALEGFERVFGPEHPDTLTSVNNLAGLLLSKGDYDAAEPLFRRTLDARERALGPDHSDTLASVNNLAGLLIERGDYDAAEPLFRRALEGFERVFGLEHPNTLTSVGNLAGSLEDKSDYDAAEPLYRRALEARERVLGPEHPATLASVNNLAALLYSKGDYDAAEPLFHRALIGRERILGMDHSDTLTSVCDLAVLLYSKGDYDAAEPLYRHALESCERIFGPGHPDTLGTVNSLAFLLKAKGDYDAAEPLYRRALEARERVLGPEHPDTLVSVDNLALLLDSKGDYDAAEPLLRRALEARERVLGPEHPNTLNSVNNLAFLLYSKGDYAAAEPLCRRALEADERNLGSSHPKVAEDLNNLAWTLRCMGDLSGAEECYRRVLGINENGIGPEITRAVAMAHNELAFHFDVPARNWIEAESHYRRSVELWRSAGDPVQAANVELNLQVMFQLAGRRVDVPRVKELTAILEKAQDERAEKGHKLLALLGQERS
ncbi:MAG TPA: tetratricopeptide repeat protein [Armatimonadota bacterium]|nr:tetratricopeptide repeat protein [Armatimonadota bacterium]